MFKTLALSTFLIAAGSTCAMAQERQWSLDIGDTDAYLVFGVPETDDVGISFWCTLKSGEISIFLPETESKLKAGRQVGFTVTAGGQTVKLKGKTTVNEEAGSTSVESKVPDNNPLFAALKKADRFKVKVGASENVYPLADADLSGLLEACHKP